MTARAELAFLLCGNFCRGFAALSFHHVVFLPGVCSSCDEDASATGFLDSLLSSLGEKFGLHDNWDLWEDTLSEDLEVSLQKHNVKKLRSKII